MNKMVRTIKIAIDKSIAIYNYFTDKQNSSCTNTKFPYMYYVQLNYIKAKSIKLHSFNKLTRVAHIYNCMHLQNSPRKYTH